MNKTPLNLNFFGFVNDYEFFQRLLCFVDTGFLFLFFKNHTIQHMNTG